MRVFAYCTQSLRVITERAAGTEARACPPWYGDGRDWDSNGRYMIKFRPAWMEGYQLLYFALHGRPGDPAWYGDGGIVALTAEMVRQADLTDSVVFSSACHLPESPMLEAFLDAGASWVIGGSGENWGPTGGPLYGAPLLGLWLRKLLGLGFEPQRAFRVARGIAQLRRLAARDTAEFGMYYRDGEDLCVYA